MLDRKFHIIDAMTGGGPFNLETAEVELEAYVQERLAAARAETERYRPIVEEVAEGGDLAANGNRLIRAGLRSEARAALAEAASEEAP